MQARLGQVSPWATAELLPSFSEAHSLVSWEELRLRDLPALGPVLT